MIQLLQSLKTGDIQLSEIPCPQITQKQLLIETQVSLISTGTERMLLDFGRSGIIGKIKQQPEKVKQVIEKIKTDGLFATFDAVQSKLDQAIPMGYSNVGRVLECGVNVTEFAVGDRVVSNGAHAQIVCVGKNLCAKIPDNVSDEEAAFTVLGAIALQGVRLAQPTLGECFVVIGLGLIGLLTVQLLHANGCKVLGLDFNSARCELAKQFGAEVYLLSESTDVLAITEKFSQGCGVDGVLITASTSSNEPVSQAAKICRKRGRIVLVGVTGLELSRADFYEKELSFQVSCSYGPGRYDPQYEKQGHDYPIGFVRWTEQRNFVAFLELLAAKKIDVQPLISHRFSFDEAEKAYALLASNQASLGILLHYPKVNNSEALLRNTLISLATPTIRTVHHPAIGFIGAGNYAGRILMPAFKKSAVILKTIATRGGISAVYYGKKFGFQKATSDVDLLLHDSKIQAVIIATQHNTHATLVCKALTENKHVFVEKPLCLTQDELENIKATWQEHTTQLVMVGFNRRFAPHIQKTKTLLKNIVAPKHMIMTVNAGFIPKEHWTQDSAIGGGRLIGEACHFIDLLRFIADVSIVAAELMSINHQQDQISILLKFSDESIGVIHYLANGHKAFPKERLEIFTAGKIITIDNFRKMQAYGFKHFSKMNLWRQDKGQNACATAFVTGIQQGIWPIPLEEIFEVQQWCLHLAKLV